MSAANQVNLIPWNIATKTEQIAYFHRTVWFIGRTPLHDAVSYRQYNAAGLLISSGANVNSKDNFGDSILGSAFMIYEMWHSMFCTQPRSRRHLFTFIVVALTSLPSTLEVLKKISGVTTTKVNLSNTNLSVLEFAVCSI